MDDDVETKAYRLFDIPAEDSIVEEIYSGPGTVAGAIVLAAVVRILSHPKVPVVVPNIPVLEVEKERCWPMIRLGNFLVVCDRGEALRMPVLLLMRSMTDCEAVPRSRDTHTMAHPDQSYTVHSLDPLSLHGRSPMSKDSERPTKTSLSNARICSSKRVLDGV